MSVRSTAVRSFVALALLGAVAACGKSTSPVSPSSTTAPTAAASPAGATITGLVTGSSATSGLVVSADGTGISSPVNSSSRFQLSGVPAGSVQLRFTGTGVNAATTLGNVTEQETVDVTVSVNGNTATIMGQDRGGSDSSSEAEGIASGVGGSCPALRFSIGSKLVTTSAQTMFSGGACADVKDGVEVDAKGTAQSDGSIAAQSLKIDAPPGRGQMDLEDLEGLVTSVSESASTFQVSGKTVAVSGQTSIRHGSTNLKFSDISEGDRVQAKGTWNAAGTVLAAVSIEVEDVGQDHSAAITGPITAVGSGSCPALSFTVRGTTVSTMSGTAYIGGACRDLKVGASVEVQGARQPDASIQASKVVFDSRD